jgi:AcrR family transcriptional regulator
MALAADGGLEELTLDAIAARAGVGRPTIYRRWPSKDALLEEALERIFGTLGTIPQSGHIRDDLIEWTRINIQHVQSPLRSMWVAYFNLEEAHLATDAIKRLHDRSADMIRQAIARGELQDNADPDLLVESIFAIVWYQVTAHHRHLESSFAETAVDLVLNSWWAPGHPLDAAKPRKGGRRRNA